MKALRVKRSDYLDSGSYLITLDDFPLDSELYDVLNGDCEIGTVVSFELIEISDEDYKNTKEFTGW